MKKPFTVTRVPDAPNGGELFEVRGAGEVIGLDSKAQADWLRDKLNAAYRSGWLDAETATAKPVPTRLPRCRKGGQSR